jgi:hypothetical protein
MVDDHLDPQSTQDAPSQGGYNVVDKVVDSSWPIFSMYSEAAEKKDTNFAESLQRDGDGVLIFVSPCFDIQISLCMKQEHYRPVYSLPLSLRSFP